MPIDRFNDGEYLTLPREFLTPDAVTGVNLYLQVGGRFVLYRSGAEPVDGWAIGKLRRRNVDTLYVLAEERDELDSYIVRHLRRVIAQTHEPLEQGRLIRDAAVAMLRSSLHRVDSPEAYERMRGVTAVMAERIAADASLLPSLVRFSARPGRLFSHSTNVTAYALVLAARQASLTDHDLTAIGLGAMLHDVGLTRMDPGVLERPPDQLTDIERSYLSRHPDRGLRLLEQAGIDDPVVREIVGGHHEPAAGARSLAVQIVQLADVFDRLTADQGRDGGRGPFAALYEMRHRMDGRFSAELVRDFVLVLGTLPHGDADSPVAPLSRRTARRARPASAA